MYVPGGARMTAFVWIVAIERYDGTESEGRELDLRVPVGERALTLASAIAARDPNARIVLSSSLPDSAVYRERLGRLPASVLHTGATAQDLQEALEQLEGEGTLLVYWVGHGVMVGNRRYLVTAESRSRTNLTGIEVDSLLTHLRSACYPRSQTGFIDACAQVIADPTTVTLGGAGDIATEQFVYFSAAAAETAVIDTSDNGFSATVIGLLTEDAQPFPPAPAALCDELERRFKTMPLLTRACCLRRTRGSGDLWEDVKQPTPDLAGLARAANCTFDEFSRLREACAGCVDDQTLYGALRDDRMDALLDSLKKVAGVALDHRMDLLGDAWRRMQLTRALSVACQRIGLRLPDWLEVRDQVVTLDNLQILAPGGELRDLLAGVLDQALPDRGVDSCIRLLALGARRARTSAPGPVAAFIAEVRGLAPLSARWDQAVATLPAREGPVFLLIGLACDEVGRKASIVNSWLYDGNEMDHSWREAPGAGGLAEQLNELMDRAKGRYVDRPLIVELLAPSRLLCGPRDLFELVDHDLETRTWLEGQSAMILRWHERMKGRDAKLFPGSWKQQARALATSVAVRPDLEIGWADEAPQGQIVGIPFPGPSPEQPRRNLQKFFDALKKGDPWMCWPRVDVDDVQAFKARVRTFVQDNGAQQAGSPHGLAEALRVERSKNQDTILCSLWLFIDDPARNPYDTLLTDAIQRILP